MLANNNKNITRTEKLSKAELLKAVLDRRGKRIFRNFSSAARTSAPLDIRAKATETINPLLHKELVEENQSVGK